MSLKAKLEAVIYAAEEPVTLAQLAALFPEEILAEIASEKQAEAEPETASERSSTGETSPEFWSGEETIIPVDEVAAAASNPPEGDASTEAAVEISAKDTGGVSSEAAAKQEARLRERLIRSGLKQILDGLMADYAAGDRGMEIREVAGGYRMATKPEYHDAVRGFVKSLKPPLKLSLPALETLAVVAYKQPVTAPEVSEIRGVDSGGVLGSLISRKLISTAGRKPVIGRPILYKTSREFLLRFGLKGLGDLPSMEEFEKMAGELAEPDEETSAPAESAALPFASPEVQPVEGEEAPALAADESPVVEDVSADGATADEQQAEGQPSGQATGAAGE